MIPCSRQTTRTSYDRNCRQPEVRIGKCTSAAKLYGHKPYYAEKNCDKRFLDRAINLIPDSGSKALWPWSHSSEPWALSFEPWSQHILGLSPEPIYHVTTLEKCGHQSRELVWGYQGFMVYTGRFATTIFSATQRCHIVGTLFQMVATLFQHCNAVLR